MEMSTKSPKEKTKVCDVSEVLEKFGNYQLLQFILLCVPAFFTNMIDINYVFVAGDLNYKCKIPECEIPNPTYEVPWWPNASIDRCSKPVLSAEHVPGTPCTDRSFSGALATCEEWVYETNNTVIAGLNLACSPWQANLIGTVHNVGLLVSRLAAGWMADRFGRKPVLIFCVVSCWIGQLKTLASSYYMYVTIEFLEAALTGGSYSTAMMLMLEICGKKNRLLAGVVFSYAMYFGECLFAIIAMFVPYWKHLIHIINGPSIFFISYIFLIRESPKWQIISGSTEKAKETMLVIAKMNKININRQELADISKEKLKHKFNISDNEKREGLREILKSKEIMKRVIVTMVYRFTASFVYFGMMINSVFLPGNKYTNFLLATGMSFPGELISLYLMNRIGRRTPLVAGFILSGVVCVGAGYIPASYIWAKILLFLLGKMLISMCFTGALTYTMELFPTSARGSLLGFGAFTSKVGSMLAPLTPMLNPISEALPAILFGCSALLSGALLTLTPETKDLPLMDTIRQVEESVNNDKKLNKKTTEDVPEYVLTHL